MNQLTRNKFLSNAEYAHLVHTLELAHARHPRDTTLLEVSMNTGARPSEVLAIRAQDLDEEHHTVYIKGLKGSREREIPLPPALFKRLQSMAAKIPDKSNRLFPIALRTYQGIWNQYRPAKKGVRSLRHTFAIRLYDRTKDVRLVQIALGHRNLNTTQIYVEYIYQQEELKKLLL